MKSLYLQLFLWLFLHLLCSICSKANLLLQDNLNQKTMKLGEFGSSQRKIVFTIGVGGLCCVPIFKSITHLPPFVGIMLVLGLLWTITEIFYHQLHRVKGDGVTFAKRVTSLLSRIDMVYYSFLPRYLDGGCLFGRNWSIDESW